jgi:hypothetical protein
METPAKKTRAPRVTSPGARRLGLTGVMAVPDNFGRIRVLLADPLPRGSPDASWRILRDSLPGGPERTSPYALREPDEDGVRGEFWAVPPAHRKAHWLGVAEALRGQEVRVEVTVRYFSYAGAGRQGSGAGGDREAARLKGAALDVALIEPLAAARAPITRPGQAGLHI